MDFTVIISDRKARRRRVPIIISRLAKETGYHKSHMSRIFSGQTKPSMECLFKISTALQITVDELAAVLMNTDFREKRKKKMNSIRTIYAELEIG